MTGSEMLRLRRNLQPWVSNQLAALSAVLLLVSSLPGISDSVPVRDTSSTASVSSRQESTETEQAALSTLRAATRQGIKISLLILGHH